MKLIQSDQNAEHHRLAAVLEGFDCPAILVSADYQILASNRHYEEAFGALEFDKNPRCYKVSHGYNVPCDQAGESCPLAAAQASRRKERVLHIHQTPNGKEHVDVEMLPIFDTDGSLLFFVELLKPVPLASGKIADQEMIGSSGSFRKLLERISRVASSEVSVLLHGESGTGKELAARAIHMSSQRRNNPMVTLECSGLTDALFESELFGHVKGAFTGAHTLKKGLIELADGGTLFLDEIADIPLTMQVKLLRLIETRTFRRVGSTETQTSNFRLISATHKNLKAMVEQGAFRQDLYYRINVFPIALPTLSERREDIPQIAKALLRLLAPDDALRLTNSACKILQSLDYPGNIRELRNIISRATVYAETNVIDDTIIQKCLEGSANNEPSALPSFGHANGGKDYLDLKTAEFNYLKELTDAFPDKNDVARIAGISVRSLYRKLETKD